MSRFTGLNPGTLDNLTLHSVVIYRNADLEALESTVGEGENAFEAAISNAKNLGITQGDVSFSTNRTRSDIDFNGALGPVVGMNYEETVSPTLTVRLIEQGEENLSLIHAGSRVVRAGKFWKITGAPVGDEDYIKNIIAVGRVKGSEEPVVIALMNCLAESPTITRPSKGTEPIPVTFRAHFPRENASDESEVWRIYWPARDAEDDGGDAGGTSED